jgi:hypothetical protein
MVQYFPPRAWPSVEDSEAMHKVVLPSLRYSRHASACSVIGHHNDALVTTTAIVC